MERPRPLTPGDIYMEAFRNILVMLAIDMSRRSINMLSLGISMRVCIHVQVGVDVM